MLIDFESSGGYANLRLSWHADTQQLPANTAAEITQLVESSGVLNFTQSDIPATPPGPPDVMSYTLSILEADQQTILSMNDMTVPESLRPLLTLLQKLAVNQKLNGQ